MHVHLCIFQCLLCKPVNYVQFIRTQDLEIRRNRNRVPLGREKKQPVWKESCGHFGKRMTIQLSSNSVYISSIQCLKLKTMIFASLCNIFMLSTFIVWQPQHVGSRRGHLSYFTQHRPSGSLIYAADWILPPADLSSNCSEAQSVGRRKEAAVHCTCLVSCRQDTEMGGHCLGTRLFPVFTTKDTTVPGLNHRVSLAPTAVTQTNRRPADLLLLHMTVSLCTTFQLMWVSTITRSRLYLSQR